MCQKTQMRKEVFGLSLSYFNFNYAKYKKKNCTKFMLSMIYNKHTKPNILSGDAYRHV